MSLCAKQHKMPKQKIGCWSLTRARPGYTDIPRSVMAGYTVMSTEAMNQLPATVTPTHVFVQGGCGGLAGAVCVDLWHRYESQRPHFYRGGTCTGRLPISERCCWTIAQHLSYAESIMGGLSCGESISTGLGHTRIGC
ncbi:MAG: hypothetical protein CM1200mP18_22170 [Gammaproteobacteria bacterium]|nr:MAG: hypothetical protein CM1200mP18_22170 [Gammaproteobacteria bacterium]